MWVQDSPAGQETVQQGTVWDRLNPLNLGSRRSPPPVQVEVRWYDGWSMTNLTDHQFSRPDISPLNNGRRTHGEAGSLSSDARQAADDKPGDQQESALAAV